VGRRKALRGASLLIPSKNESLAGRSKRTYLERGRGTPSSLPEERGGLRKRKRGKTVEVRP